MTSYDCCLNQARQFFLTFGRQIERSQGEALDRYTKTFYAFSGLTGEECEA